MFFLDMIILAGILSLAYGCFWAGAKFGTLKKLFAAVKEQF